MKYGRWAAAAAAALVAAPAAAQAPRFHIDTVRVEVGSRAGTSLATRTRAVEVIGAERLAALPVRTVGEALDWALGADVMARSPAQVDLAVRGSTFEQVLVLVDGVRVNDPQTGHFALNLALPLEQVERIEVLRGAASAQYGTDALGGAVNIVTRRGSGTRGSARLEHGTWGSSTLAGAVQAGSAGARIDAAGDLQRSDGHRAGTDFRILQGRVAAEAPLRGRTLRADLARAARDFGADGFYAPRPSYEETRTTTAGLAWLAAPAARTAVDLRASYRLHDDDFILIRDNPAVYRNLHTSTRFGGEAVARTAVAPGVRLVGGGEWYRDALQSTNLGDREESRGALFAEAAADLRGDLVVTLGGRGDWHSEFGGFFAPSVALGWWPRGDLRLRTSLGRAFRAPTWTERFYEDPSNVGTPDLLPERAWSAEAGVDLLPLPGARLSLTGWVRDAEELIDWARSEGSDAVWRTRNVGNARFRGVEAAAEMDVARVRVGAQLSLLDFEADAAQGFVSKYALRPLTRTASLSLAREVVSGLDASGRVRHSLRAGDGAAPLGACRADARVSATTVDGRVSYRRGAARIYGDVRNAADREWCDITVRPAPGRSLSVGVEWRP